ncbi:MAG: DUF1223 domain-containing protein [Verrucomicrobiota bacterium]
MWRSFVALILFVGAHRCASAADDLVIKGGPERVSLVELYTSEGCSSCPPAEKWLSGLQKDPRLWRTLVPVAFHVDYWDRLGWKDRFAQASFTERQRAYSTGAAASSVYTPGFVVDGREWRGWFENVSLPSRPERVGVIEARSSSTGDVIVNFSSQTKFEEGTAHVAWLGFGLVSDVRRGENAGHSLRHDFVVLNHASGKLSRNGEGRWTAKIESPRISDRPGAIAVWVETGGRPVQAAGGWLGRSLP